MGQAKLDVVRVLADDQFCGYTTFAQKPDPNQGTDYLSIHSNPMPDIQSPTIENTNDPLVDNNINKI